jgi:hypothetical protein
MRCWHHPVKRHLVLPLLAGLLAVALVLCWVHGIEAGDHGLTHTPCVPVVAVLSAVVLLPFVGATGWLFVPAVLTVVAASPHLPDPPPKSPARS